jgi:FAD/FMN-containing dehydrogenase/Fe-S oxidoreductase
MTTIPLTNVGYDTSNLKSIDVDAEALAAELRAQIDGEVRFDDGSRALYAADASNYRQTPIGVVIPKNVEDVVKTVAVARRYGAPILSRGCGTSLAGQCCNVAVVIDFSKYLNQVVETDPQRKRARVLPGIIRDNLVKAVAEHNLTFGPDTSTHPYATIGGMIGNNSCGVRSVMAEFAGLGARTSDNIEEMEILTYDGTRMRVGPTSDEELEQIIRAGGRKGEIYSQLRDLRDKYADLIRKRIPDIPRRVSGYNLDELLPEKGFNVARALVGSEGTCAITLEATTLLIDDPAANSLLVLGYPSVYEAADHIPDVMAHRPTGCEGSDDLLIKFMQRKDFHTEYLELLPEGGGWLFVEFGGQSTEEANEHARELMRALEKTNNPPTMRLYDNPEDQEKVWQIRESGLGATAFVPGMEDTWPGWEDSAAPPDRLGDYLRDLRELYDKYGYQASLYGHFGQGCVHSRINFDLRTAEGIEKYKAFTREAAELLVHKHGGSLSGEHGDGQARGDLLSVMYGEELMQAFREFKRIWDPDWKMNPGKVVNADARDEHLRLGTDFRPWTPKTHFQFPDDRGSFARATLRCVGVGKCRREAGGTMCPSFMVLREEKHTTRGRAHLLFEMLQGDVVKNGWRDEYVKESLDLCLSCKGCKGDCPVNVDIATYKAEFLSHYYAGRLRPRSAYAFGLIFYWARLAALMPRVANFFTQTPVLSNLAKAVAEVAPERQIPVFAPQTFKAWFHQRGPCNEGQPKVILWPDTFNNYFHPEIAKAAVEVLEVAGYQVVIPQQFVCCGRPLYEYGMLNLAKHRLRAVLDALRSEIRAGTPMVGLEPSCTAVFRDELPNLFPNDEDAKRLYQQTFTLGEFLTQKVEDYAPPQLHRKAIVHGHCHHKAIMGMDAELEVLKKLGLDFELLDSGCCGMAGSFGFEQGDRYDVSIGAGERVLLPAVRNAAQDTLIMTDGFSCREQIAQTTDRHALHLAQVIQMAMHEGPSGPAEEHPEANYITSTDDAVPHSMLRSAAIMGAGVLTGGAVAWRLIRRRSA